VVRGEDLAALRFIPRFFCRLDFGSRGHGVRDLMRGLVARLGCKTCAFAFVQGERNERVTPESGNLGFLHYFNTLMRK
jgi:hypothetical protein